MSADKLDTPEARFEDESGHYWTLPELLEDLDAGEHLYMTPKMCADLAAIIRKTNAAGQAGACPGAGSTPAPAAPPCVAGRVDDVSLAALIASHTDQDGYANTDDMQQFAIALQRLFERNG